MHFFALFLRLILYAFSLRRAEAQIIPLTISGEGNVRTWKEAVFHCWDEHKVRGLRG